MARHIRAQEIEAVPRPVTAVGNDYPAGHVHPAHRHRRSQLLFAEWGTMLVQTADGAWMVPAHQGIWIPAGVTHGITMLSRVATRSVYLEDTAADGMARQCQVVGISPLLRQLLIRRSIFPRSTIRIAGPARSCRCWSTRSMRRRCFRSACRFRTTGNWRNDASGSSRIRRLRTRSSFGPANSD